VLPEPQQVELRESDVLFGPAWSLDRGAGVAQGDVAARNAFRGVAIAFRLACGSGRRDSGAPRNSRRRFLHQLDDVKDHGPDRTVDMSYLVYRELQLPFGEWVTAIRSTRNQYAAANHLPGKKGEFDWRDTETVR
jgi:hypothetical protein